MYVLWIVLYVVLVVVCCWNVWRMEYAPIGPRQDNAFWILLVAAIAEIPAIWLGFRHWNYALLYILAVLVFVMAVVLTWLRVTLHARSRQLP